MSAPDPIQEAVAHFRDDADFNRSWADGRRGHIQPTNADYIARRLEVAAQRECWADAIEAREAKIERLRRVELAAGNLDRYSLVIDSAVRNDDPGNADGVTAAILRLRDAMNMKQGNATSNPSEDTSSADRDAAGTTTHLPAGAPLLRSPASGSGTFYSEAYVFRLCAALKAARELIQKHDNWHHNVGTVLFPAEEGQIGPTWINLSAEYADATLCEDTIAVLAQIDEVMK